MLVPGPTRNYIEEWKVAVKAGKKEQQFRFGNPNNAPRSDIDARWTTKSGREAMVGEAGTELAQSKSRVTILIVRGAKYAR